jgi:hypothetical protein
MGINHIFKKYREGGYKTYSPEAASHLLKGKKVRIGAYGDPGAVPLEVWEQLLKYCTSTGYTHQWKVCSKEYAKFCMASCDTEQEVLEAHSLGYRTFFVQSVDTVLEAKRSVLNVKLAWCPASKELGKVTQCSDCMVCSGNRTKYKSNVSILKH